MEQKKMNIKKISPKLSTIFLIVGIIGTIVSEVLFFMGNFLISMISTIIMVPSFVLLFLGAYPKLAKITAKIYTETMDYAGKNISEASVKTVEVATPAIRKTGEAVAPAVADIVKEVKKADGAVKEDTEEPDKFCPYCGEGLDDEFKFCPKCGKEL